MERLHSKNLSPLAVKVRQNMKSLSLDPITQKSFKQLRSSRASESLLDEVRVSAKLNKKPRDLRIKFFSNEVRGTCPSCPK
jgi:ribosome recycling factor